MEKKLFDALPSTNQGNKNKLPQIIDPVTIPLSLQSEWLGILKNEKKCKPLPLKDEKRLIAHNSLLISGLVDAAVALNDISILYDSITLEKWVASEFLDKSHNLLSYVYPTKKSISFGNLDDYCFYIQALLDISAFTDLVKKGSASLYIRRAEEVLNNVIEKFKDPEMNGFFFSDESLPMQPPCRKKIWYDNATPAANSSLLKIFSNLYHLTGKNKWYNEYNESISAYTQLARNAPAGVSYALSAICEDAIGIITLEIPRDQCKEMMELLSCATNRKVFINPTNKEIDNIQLKVGNENEVIQIDNLESLSEYLNK